jgi:hypothetical protein
MKYIARAIWITVLATLLNSVLASCGSMDAKRLEVDPDQVNVNAHSFDVLDRDRLNVNS